MEQTTFDQTAAEHSTAAHAAIFLALMATSLAMAAALAHALELPNKMTLGRDDYFTVQSIYAGWNRLAALLLIQLAGIVAVCFVFRHQSEVRNLALIALASLVAAQAIFWIWTFPANQATASWTLKPPNWEALRYQCEYSHFAGAVFQVLAMASLIVAVLKRS
ncbi:MAG: DUF1772 domain-containing protein [Vicinamibacterales bacterium]